MVWAQQSSGPSDSENDFRSGCRNVSRQQQLFSELPSPERAHCTNTVTQENLEAMTCTWSEAR